MWINNLDELQMLLAVYEAGSFTAAAHKLGLSTSAVSTGVRRLESELGVRLLERSTRRLRPTPEGEVLIEHGRRALDVLAEGRDLSRALGGSLTGKLSVATSTVLGTYFFADWLAAFVHRHPGLQLQMSVDDDRVELVRAGVDVALRNGPLEDSDLSARHLTDLTWVACASPDYLARHGTPKTPGELEQHACITHRIRARYFDHWVFQPKAGGDPVEVMASGPLSTDNVAIAVQWALAGSGILYQSSLALRAMIGQGTLVPLFEDYRGHSVPLYAVFPARRLAPLRVRRMIDEITQAIRPLTA